jgi:curved DNA-binding protein CbpA
MAAIESLNGEDPYDILGVKAAATFNDIHAAYRRMAAALHPDNNPRDPRAKEQFQRVLNAYDVLRDPHIRRQYDEMARSRDQRRQAPTPPQPSNSSTRPSSDTRITTPPAINVRPRKSNSSPGGCLPKSIPIPLFILFALAISKFMCQPARAPQQPQQQQVFRPAPAVVDKQPARHRKSGFYSQEASPQNGRIHDFNAPNSPYLEYKPTDSEYYGDNSHHIPMQYNPRFRKNFMDGMNRTFNDKIPVQFDQIPDQALSRSLAGTWVVIGIGDLPYEGGVTQFVLSTGGAALIHDASQEGSMSASGTWHVTGKVLHMNCTVDVSNRRNFVKGAACGGAFAIETLTPDAMVTTTDTTPAFTWKRLRQE